MNPEERYLQYKHLPKETVYRLYSNPKQVAKNHRIEVEDLIAYAAEGLFKACLNFDDSKCKFTTYAINYMRWNLQEKLSRECNVFKVNPNNIDWDHAYKLISIDDELKDKYGEVSSWHDVIPSDVNVEGDVKSDLGEDYILNNLTNTQKHIIQLHNKGMSYRKIGELFGISGEAVRDRLIKARKPLKKYYNCEVV